MNTTITAATSRTPRSTLRSLLDRTHARLLRDPSVEGVAALISKLEDLRLRSSADAWRAFAVEAQAHPLAALLREDPYTRRALEKPRGYAGDAVMLDYVYGLHGIAPDALTSVGRAVWGATTGAASAEAVRDRRRRLAALADEAAAARRGAEVVSIAAGHAREIELSSAFARGEISRWRCLDQDAESLGVIAERFGGDPRVEATPCAVRDVLRRGVEGEADLIYTAGLLDYLSGDVARALLARLWRGVRAGGRLVVANFADDSRERGYMEACMDWWLIYRAESDLAAFGAELDGASVRVFRDPTRRTVWLEARRDA